jgi:phospholipase A1/A2
LKKIAIIISLFFVFVVLGYSENKNISSDAKEPNVIGDSSIFQYHKPIYFIAGKDDAKVQISFKYRLLNRFNFYLGYTQRMFWDVFDKSGPIKRLDYNPELFYRFLVSKKFVKNFDLGFYEHMSNGQAGEYSRSLDGGYLRINAKKDILGFILGINAKIFVFYAQGGQTKLIENYIGYSELEFFNDFSNKSIFKYVCFNLRFISPGKFSHDYWRRGAREFGFKFKIIKTRFSPILYFQIYDGYAESLLNFYKRDTVYRIGLMFP